MSRHFAGSISQLIGDEDAALAAYLHAGKSLVKAGDHATHADGEAHGLRRVQLGLAIVAQDRFAVLILERLAMVFGGVELDTVGGAVAGVDDLAELA